MIEDLPHVPQSWTLTIESSWGLIERWPSVQSVRLASQSSGPAPQALAMFEPFRPKAVGHWVELLVLGADNGRALPIFFPGLDAKFPSQAAGKRNAVTDRMVRCYLIF